MRALRFSICLIAATLVTACSGETSTTEQSALVRAFIVGEPVVSESQAIVEGAIPARTNPGQAIAEVAGEVLEILVSAGDRVNAGQALVRIDPRDIRLADSSARVQAQAARAELGAAEADFLRFTELKEKRFISQAEWERRRAALELSRARFEATLDQLGVASSRALQSARVESVDVRVRDPVFAGQVLVRLAPDRPAYSAHSTPSRPRGAGLVIPITAVIDGQAVMKVVTVGQDRFEVQRQPVRLGAVRDREVQVLEGLDPGDRIVAVGAHLLTSGQSVRVMQPRGR